MEFDIVSEIQEAETFASGSGIRELPRLRKLYGIGFWRKRKGFADVRLPDNSIHRAEVHWYEAAGVGKKEFESNVLLSNTCQLCTSFVICIKNDGYRASLELRKLVVT
ncbi:MAG: hypothetical protein R3E89_11690 [Thiolinea sp.]